MIYHLQAVTQRYGEREVLRVPQLEIQGGEILALVGPSGAGKSTLLRLLALLETPAAGQVSFAPNGTRYSAAAAPIEARREVAMVFQRPVLMTRSVRANVAYGLKLRRAENIEARVDEALERVRLAHLAKARPATLSGGELQRVSIARALVLQPRVLLLDEPTANLDPYNVRLIEELLCEQHARYQTTIVLVTHNIFQARRLAQRVAFLYDGDLVEVADTHTFFENPQDGRSAAFVRGDTNY